jgi:hypothetical protein
MTEEHGGSGGGGSSSSSVICTFLISRCSTYAKRHKKRAFPTIILISLEDTVQLKNTKRNGLQAKLTCGTARSYQNFLFKEHGVLLNYILKILTAGLY